MSIEKTLEPLVPAEMEIEIEIDPEEEEASVEVEIKPVTFEENLESSMEIADLDAVSDEVLTAIKIRT